VTALGTAFDVRTDASTMKVVLVEGKVRVRPPESRDRGVEMTAGHAFVGDRNGWRLSRVDTHSETSWLTGNLVFRDETLDDIVAELNRYGADKIVIADPGVGRQRLSAVLKSGDTAAFLNSVELLKVATVKRTGPHEIRLLAQN
jgi:transmembrane sensor